MRACSDTANSTRSSLSRPISTFCAWRTRRIWTKNAIARRRARKPAAAAPIATQPTAVVSELGTPPNLSEGEDHRVLSGVVRRVLLAGDRIHVDLHDRPRPERRRAEVDRKSTRLNSSHVK